jgi:hypothetical protein
MGPGSPANPTKGMGIELFAAHLNNVNPPDTGHFANFIECDKELKAVRILLVTDTDLN